MRITLLALPLVLISATPSGASVFNGNPILSFRVDRAQGDYLDGIVTLNKVSIEDCAGTVRDYAVNRSIDLVVGSSVTIDGGDLCRATFHWDTDLDIDGDGLEGAYTVRYAEDRTTVTLDADMDWVRLEPFSVLTGTMVGGGPKLLVWIE